MTTLIAVDGFSLNSGLQKVAQSKKRNPVNPSRFRIDHASLAEFLEETCSSEGDTGLRFYTDSQKITNDDSRLMGRVTKYFAAKGYGFISATDGSSYFFHNNEVLNKKALCNSNEDRYPHPTSREFQSRILNKVVTFDSGLDEDGRSKAEEVRLEFGSRVLDTFYRLRREPFLVMLEDSGYKIIRCRSLTSTGKSKGVDCKIYLDALSELDEDDHFILLSDDAVFCELLDKLVSYDIKVTVVTFNNPLSKELRNSAAANGIEVILLDEHLDHLELEYEDDDAETEDISEEEEALAST